MRFCTRIFRMKFFPSNFLQKGRVAMQYTYIPQGVCSRRIDVELEGNVIKKVHFTGGCDGNLKAISKIVEGMTVETVQEKFTGIRCGLKNTSCSDQLAKAVGLAFQQLKQQVSV